MNTDKNLFPLMIDLTDKKVVIIGSGNVALRKARLLSDHTAVLVVANNFDNTFKQLQVSHPVELMTTDIVQISDNELEKLTADAFLVIPATRDPDLNARIGSIAKKSGTLVNQVDTVGEVIIPSVVTQGDLTIGISTKGASPALSRYTRMKIDQLISSDYADMARLQKEMREYYKGHIADQKTRKQRLWNILNNEDVWLALAESYEKAIAIARRL